MAKFLLIFIAIARHSYTGKPIYLLLFYLFYFIDAQASCMEISKNTIKIDFFTYKNNPYFEKIIFFDETYYYPVTQGKQRYVEAKSSNSASGLLYKKKIDLHATPILRWRWRLTQPLVNTREKTREGDDFAARLYIVIGGGLRFWQRRALSYVWTHQIPAGEYWPNPFAGDSAMMFSLRSASAVADTWAKEKRNVFLDLKQVFGREIRYIDAIAVMTDTDNTHSQAAAHYGEICFNAF